jgi:hypothetical protein
MLLIILSLLIRPVGALVSEKLALFQIVSNTAFQINELEELVSNTENYTKVLRETAEIAEDKIYLAERIELWADDMKYLFDKDEKGLERINSSIRNLKMQKEELIRIYSKLEFKKRKNQLAIKQEQNEIKRNSKALNSYKRSALRNPRKSSEALKKISQHTGASAYETAKTNLLVTKTNIELKKINNTLIAREQRELKEKILSSRIYGEESRKALRSTKK